MKIGKLIAQRRAELGLTYEQIGEFVGVGKSTVRKWEKGLIKNMGADKIELLSFILKISPLDFFDTYYEPAKTITPAETRHLEKYRSLDEENKEDVDDYLAMKLAKQKLKSKDTQNKAI